MDWCEPKPRPEELPLLYVLTQNTYKSITQFNYAIRFTYPVPDTLDYLINWTLAAHSHVDVLRVPLKQVT